MIILYAHQFQKNQILKRLASYKIKIHLLPDQSSIHPIFSPKSHMRNKLLFSILFLLFIFILGMLAADPLYHALGLKKREAISVVIFCIAMLTGIFSFFLYRKSSIPLVSWILVGTIGASVLNTNASFMYLSGLFLATTILVHRLSRKSSAT